MGPDAAPAGRGTGSRYRFALAALAVAILPGIAAAADLVSWRGADKPPLRLDNLDRVPIGLDDFAGRPVIVHFFATWCPPCVEEMAALTRLDARTPPETLGILVVDVAEVPVRVRRFFAENPVGFPVLLDQDRAVTRAWEVVSLPTSFVLDARHRPVLHAEGDVDWDAPAVDAALRELIETTATGG